MPSVSGAQHRAMEAAAHGNSTLGIPADVGKEFSEADKGHHFTDQASAMRHHGLAAGEHKRHPATSHYSMGVAGEGNRYRSKK